MKLETVVLGPLCANCYILSENGRGIVIDPGAKSWKLVPYIQDLEITHVIVTHAHFDHFMAAGEIIKMTGAKFLLSDFDSAAIHDGSVTLLDRFASVNIEIPDCDIAVKDGDELRLGEFDCRFIRTPGHAEGSVCIQTRGLLFTGDTLMRHEIGRTDLPGGDAKTLYDSLKKLFALDGDMTVLPGHGEFSTLADERINNPYMNGSCRFF